MAGVKPFFITGANAKIKVNGVTLAFATNLSYRVDVVQQEAPVLGMYEASSIEPVAYRVSGGFAVIRYAADVKTVLGNASPKGVSDKGNGPGAWSDNDTNSVTRPSPREFFNPKLLDRQSAIEIEIYQKVDGENIPFAKVKGVKLNMAHLNLSDKKAMAIQSFTYKALYVDEDSFLAQFSGLGQQFQ